MSKVKYLAIEKNESRPDLFVGSSLDELVDNISDEGFNAIHYDFYEIGEKKKIKITLE